MDRTILLKVLSSQSKERKKENWFGWLKKILVRRGLQVDTSICAYGHRQLVGQVIKVGGKNFAFRSQACTGCAGGSAIIKKAVTTGEKPPDILPCVFLESVLISQHPVTEGEVIALSRLPK